MASQIVLPQGTYPIGTRTLGPVALPVGVTSVTLTLVGSAMTDPALQVTLTLDLSLDGGTTWASAVPNPLTDPFPVTLTLVGGMIDRHTGLPQDYFVSVNQIPDPTNANRKMRAFVTIAGTPLTTQGTLTLT